MGMFTYYQLLAMEFVSDIEQHLSSEQLQKSVSSVNAASLNVFSKLLDGRAGKYGGCFESIAAARASGEPVITDFVTLRRRVVHHRAHVCALLAFSISQHRAHHSSVIAVSSLPSTASLLEVMSVSAAPRSSGTAPNDPGVLAVVENWAEGGYTVRAMEGRLSYDMRSVAVSLKESQTDILHATRLCVQGSSLARSVTELRACRPSKRSVKLASASAAAMHAEQLLVFHFQQVALLCTHGCLFWDEGSAGGFASGVPGLLVGLTANFRGDPLNPYRNMIGLEVLTGKTGKIVAGGLLSILARRGITKVYFVVTDAVSSNIGHRTGVIAHLRFAFKTLLVFALRCEAHIAARTYAHCIVKAGMVSKRQGLKRRAQDPQVAGEVLFIEDMAYTMKKCHALFNSCDTAIPETLYKVPGCIDTRWEYTADAFRTYIGLTVVMDRKLAAWVSCMVLDGHITQDEINDLSPNALIRKARSVKLKKKTVKAYMTANLWMKDSFDLER